MATFNTQIAPKFIQQENVFFMPGVFNETLQLLTDAREYFTVFGQDDQQRLESISMKSMYCTEMSRITLRLSSILSWIMAQRAVIAGQMPAEEACIHYGLDFQETCSINNRELHAVLPAYMCYLLDRTLELYQRVQRLDSQTRNALN